MRKVGLALGFTLLWLGVVRPASAEFVYQFNQSTYNVAAGDTVDVQVFLVQNPGTTLLNSVGLTSAGVQVNWSSPAARVVSPADIQGNAPPFSFVDDSVTPPNANVDNLRVGPPVTLPAGQNSILLGTFRFTTDAAAEGQTITITARDRAGFVNTVLGNGTVIDSMIAPATASIVLGTAVIPEPSTLILVGLGSAGLGCYARWRKSRAVVA